MHICKYFKISSKKMGIFLCVAKCAINYTYTRLSAPKNGQSKCESAREMQKGKIKANGVKGNDKVELRHMTSSF